MTALHVDHISFSYRQPSADSFGLRDIAFTIEQGEFLSILGPNGSGKTTLLRVVDRIFLPHAGTIRIFGRDYRTLTRKEIARRIGVVPQEHPIIFPYTVREVVRMGRTPHVRGLGFENKRDDDVVNNAMELTDITHLAEKPITQLSGGERQRAFIARALAQEPDILLLDEPNTHLDITHQLDVLHLTRSLSKQRGLTVLAVFHDLNLAALFSTRILLLANGNAVALGSPHEVLTQNSISTVFRTKVTVDQHPFAGVPRVTIIPSAEAPLITFKYLQEKS